MAERASARDAAISFVATGGFRDPLGAAADVVLVDSLAAWVVAPWFLRRRATPPVAAIVHQPPGGVDVGRVRRTWQRPLDVALYRRCGLIIATSSATRATLVDEHGVPAGAVVVIEPGGDVPESSPLIAPPDLRGGCRIALLCVANWLPNKGLLELLDAVARLERDDALLHLVGADDVDAGYTRRVRVRLASPELTDRVVCHGAVPPDELGSLYAAADVFVLPSRRETYGTVYAEALAAGLPAIGWSSSNLGNLLEDGCEGVLLRDGDVTGLAAALARIADDGRWRAELTAAARCRGQQLPTWDASADTFFGALRKLAGRPG